MDILLNGIDALTGETLAPVMSLVEAAAAAASAKAPGGVDALRDGTDTVRGLPFGVDRTDVSQAGWGLVFHSQEDAAVRDAFAPLLQHRREQIGQDSLVKTLRYNGESVPDWLAAQGVSPGTVKPAKLPYYLFVVGGPDPIPFEFTQLLSLSYAVGRLHLDSPDDYRRYAQAVVDYDTGEGVTNAKEAVFFAPEHVGDGATKLSCELLAKPLVNGSDGEKGIADDQHFQTTALLGDDALKASLLAALSRPVGQRPPALWFSAGHGLGFPMDSALQKTSQGAVLCMDWRGRGLSPVPIPPSAYVTAADLEGANVRNLIAFVFACFGLGTPAADRYSFQPPQAPQQLSSKPFFSPLSKALLSARNGPALAMIGHVDRAFASSIQPPGAGPQIEPFQNALGMILSGVPLGLALSDFRERYAVFSALLDPMLADKIRQAPVDDQKFVSTWIQQNDAASYALFGDPAVRLLKTRLSNNG